MTQMHMEIPVVEQVAGELQRLTKALHTQAETLARCIPGSWWQGPAAREYEERLQEVRKQLHHLVQEGEALSAQLRREIAEWKRVASSLESIGPGVAAAAGAAASIAVGASVGAVAGTGSDQGRSERRLQPQPPRSQSSYRPRFDGTKPAPGMDSTYGKPGQLPLDAVVKSTPDNRDPNLYADVINQFAVGNNPRYAKDPRYPYTYCNTFAGDVARAMGHPFPTKAEWGINPRDRATIGMPDLWRYFTDPKAPIRAAEQGWKEIAVNNLQELERYVNSGKMAVVLTPDHIAVVRPNQRITDLASIRVAQAGAINANDIPLVRGFGKSRLGIIRIFVHE